MNLPERIRQLSISSFGQPCGQLVQPAQYQFSYAFPPMSAEQKPWVSLTMDPAQNQRYNLGRLHPVFAQNLPEGYVRRYLYERLLRLAEVNDIYLLALQGEKGIGHLGFDSIMELPHAEKIQLQEILSWNHKDSLFETLLEKYYLNGLMSGVQPKVMVSLESKTVIQQEDVIVKTFDEEYPLLTVNEFVCMSMAKAAGLNPPNFWLSNDLSSFVIRRFDRTELGESLGFEDFTVLMNKSNDQKYHSSYENLLKAVRLFTRSPIEEERGYRYIVFNCLIGNGDAHLKNFAVQYARNREQVTLSPPYDITHTLVYENLDNNLALKLAGSKQFPSRKQLERLGQQFNIKKPKEIIEEYGQIIIDQAHSIDQISLLPGLKESIVNHVSKTLTAESGVVVPVRDKNKKYS